MGIIIKRHIRVLRITPWGDDTVQTFECLALVQTVIVWHVAGRAIELDGPRSLEQSETMTSTY